EPRAGQLGLGFRHGAVKHLDQQHVFWRNWAIVGQDEFEEVVDLIFFAADCHDAPSFSLNVSAILSIWRFNRVLRASRRLASTPRRSCRSCPMSPSCIPINSSSIFSSPA